MRFRQQQRFKRPGRPVRHYRQPVFGFHHGAAAVCELTLGVIHQHRRALLFEILALQPVFTFGFIRQEAVGPDLTVRMRVGAAHRRAFVFKHLYPRVGFAQLGGLRLPRIHHFFERGQRQLRQRFAVIRREANHAAGAAGALKTHQRIGALRRVRRIGHQRGEIVGKHIGAGVLRVFIPGDTRVAGAEKTIGIVLRQRLFRRRLLRPLPGALGAMRRNQNPLSGQRVITTVRMIHGVKLFHLTSFNRDNLGDDVTASARCRPPFPVMNASRASSDPGLL
ncbi:hypothetical protein BN130_4011 [Cronobacter malonaticus 507]|nr:hypothetical protein BN130_4011 [Cronobacter malonaticus 507]